MDFFVDDVPVYDSFGCYDTVDVIQPAVFCNEFDVIQTVPSVGFGIGVGIAPTIMTAPAAVTTTTVTNVPQYGYGYRPGVRPVPMVSRNPYGMGVPAAYGPYGQYPGPRFY